MQNMHYSQFFGRCAVPSVRRTKKTLWSKAAVDIFGRLLAVRFVCWYLAQHSTRFRGGMQCDCVDHSSTPRKILSGIRGIQCLRHVSHLSCLLMPRRKPSPELLPRWNWIVLIHAYTAHTDQRLNWVPHWHGWNYPRTKIKYRIFRHFWS